MRDFHFRNIHCRRGLRRTTKEAWKQRLLRLSAMVTFISTYSDKYVTEVLIIHC